MLLGWEGKRIVWVRNNVEDIGSWQIDKLMPYVMPCWPCRWKKGIKKMLENGTLEVIPLGHLRGRSLRNCILYRVWKPNSSTYPVLMGRRWRLNFGRMVTKTARYLKVWCWKNVERLAGKLFAHIHLEKSERSEVAAGFRLKTSARSPLPPSTSIGLALWIYAVGENRMIFLYFFWVIINRIYWRWEWVRRDRFYLLVVEPVLWQMDMLFMENGWWREPKLVCQTMGTTLCG